MDKLARHLTFLQAVFPENATTIEQLFVEQKRSLKKTLFAISKPQLEVAEIVEKLYDNLSPQKPLAIQWLHCFCPNSSYTTIVKRAKKGIPTKLDTDSLKKLALFARVPSTNQLNEILTWAQKTTDTDASAYLLEKLAPFGRQLAPFWATIDQFAQYRDLAVTKAAIGLLAHIPSGVQKSIMTLGLHCQRKETQLAALMALQQAHNLPPNLLIQLVQPIVENYRHLLATEGAINRLWQEYRIIRSIYQNNGVPITLPKIDLSK
jgi:hypothetical protein